MEFQESDADDEEKEDRSQAVLMQLNSVAQLQSQSQSQNRLTGQRVALAFIADLPDPTGACFHADILQQICNTNNILATGGNKKVDNATAKSSAWSAMNQQNHEEQKSHSNLIHNFNFPSKVLIG